MQRPTTLSLPSTTTTTTTTEVVPEMIDLCTPTIDSESTITFDRSIVLHGKLSILAVHPTPSSATHPLFPLLANIPTHQLTDVELKRRRYGMYPAAFLCRDQMPTMPSFLREKFNLFFGTMMERCNVDLSILDYNYTRLNECMKLYIAEQIRIFNCARSTIKIIDEQEYPLLLEFFLQFDVHLFYMKTCSFRLARPRSMSEGLFCVQAPEARYDLSACGNCSLCYPHYDRTRRLQPVITFSQTHQHTFVNGYRSILNCSATCQTPNIIYVLTCPCGHYDYIGATGQSLTDRLVYHREHGYRLPHEFLLGEQNISPFQKSLLKDRMQLYQHTLRCRSAMQLFLTYHPHYWRFIPMPLMEAEEQEEKMVSSSASPLSDDPNNPTMRTKEQSFQMLKNVPVPEQGYTFSNRQLILQLHYFQRKRDFNLPNMEIDLYNASIVAVLPEKCSDMFRSMIESFFITHAEPKLNTIGHLLKYLQSEDLQRLYDTYSQRGHEWHEGLIGRPKPT